MEKIYVVTYGDIDQTDGVLAVFKSKINAEDYAKEQRKKHNGVYVDEVDLYE